MIAKNAAVTISKLAQEKKPNFSGMREALRPLVAEANLPPAWLTKLRARNAAKVEVLFRRASFLITLSCRDFKREPKLSL